MTTGASQATSRPTTSWLRQSGRDKVTKWQSGKVTKRQSDKETKGQRDKGTKGTKGTKEPKTII